ncbi:Protein TWIN LOV 1 [Glycine soja]
MWHDGIFVIIKELNKDGYSPPPPSSHSIKRRRFHDSIIHRKQNKKQQQQQREFTSFQQLHHHRPLHPGTPHRLRQPKLPQTHGLLPPRKRSETRRSFCSTTTVMRRWRRRALCCCTGTASEKGMRVRSEGFRVRVLSEGSVCGFVGGDDRICSLEQLLEPDVRELEREESCEASDDEKRSVVTAMDCIFSVLTHYGEAIGRLVCRKRSSIPDMGLLSTSLIISLGRIKQRPLICCLYDFEFPCRTNRHLPDMPTVYASDTLLNLTGFKDYKQQRPSKELVAKDLHGVEWKFHHIYRGNVTRKIKCEV